MKCEICQVNEASVHLKQVNDGESCEMYVCEKCAASNGFDPESPMMLTDFLFGVGMQVEPVRSDDGAKCAFCAMSKSEFNKRSRVGCQYCYDAFAGDINPMIESVHTGGRHAGKVPSGAAVEVELDSLQRALDQAVNQEDFEEAAILRDRIRDLSGEVSS